MPKWICVDIISWIISKMHQRVEIVFKIYPNTLFLGCFERFKSTVRWKEFFCRLTIFERRQNVRTPGKTAMSARPKSHHSYICHPSKDLNWIVSPNLEQFGQTCSVSQCAVLEYSDQGASMNYVSKLGGGCLPSVNDTTYLCLRTYFVNLSIEVKIPLTY